jgi:hypothetical protein
MHGEYSFDEIDVQLLHGFLDRAKVAKCQKVSVRSIVNVCQVGDEYRATTRDLGHGLRALPH